jgi:FkbM family methyltransferase
MGEVFGKFALNEYVWKILNLLVPTGEFCVEISNQKKSSTFRSSNTQYHAIYSNLFKHGYEPAISAIIQTFLPHIKCFYDIGSNWGYFSILAASNERFNGKIHAFEPLPSSYNDLSNNVQQLGLSQRISAHSFGLSDTSGSAHMEAGLFSGRAFVSQKKVPSINEPGIQIKRLDDLSLPSPDLIKMDVEGHESQVIKGGARIIGTHKPFIVFENSCNLTCLKHGEEPFKLLRELGYLFFYPLLVCEADGSQSLCNESYYYQHLHLVDKLHGVVLVQTDFSTRLLLEETTNFLAVHNDRLHDLENIATASGVNNAQ